MAADMALAFDLGIKVTGANRLNEIEKGLEKINKLYDELNAKQETYIRLAKELEPAKGKGMSELKDTLGAGVINVGENIKNLKKAKEFLERAKRDTEAAGNNKISDGKINEWVEKNEAAIGKIVKSVDTLEKSINRYKTVRKALEKISGAQDVKEETKAVEENTQAKKKNVEATENTSKAKSKKTDEAKRIDEETKAVERNTEAKRKNAETLEKIIEKNKGDFESSINRGEYERQSNGLLKTIQSLEKFKGDTRIDEQIQKISEFIAGGDINNKLAGDLTIESNKLRKELEAQQQVTQAVEENTQAKKENAEIAGESSKKEASSKEVIKAALKNERTILKEINEEEQDQIELEKKKEELKRKIIDLIQKEREAGMAAQNAPMNVKSVLARRAESGYAEAKTKTAELLSLGTTEEINAALPEINTQIKLADVNMRRFNSDLKEAKRLEKETADKAKEHTKEKERQARAAEEVKRKNVDIESSLRKVTDAYKTQARAVGRIPRIMSDVLYRVRDILSLYAASGFLRNIIRTGGEFEQQHIALQNIIGDLGRASSLYERIQTLAVESPFSFKELITYTKQLSAYQIPASQLFETTKRLADLSAGLGVDMNRLILAYGQVRSASVLRGQELRQFTEAGIPMVQALADKFTKLKGTVVTTADVFKLISDRAVPFKMVKEVLEDMTNEGGQFYNMQEKLSHTLLGRWSNLNDQWEIFLSKLAKGESELGFVLSKAVEGFTWLFQKVQHNATTTFNTIATLWLAINGRLVFNRLTMNGTSEKWKNLEAMRDRENSMRRIKNLEEVSNVNVLQRLIKDKKILSADIERLYVSKKITAEELKQLVEQKFIAAEEEKQILASSRILVNLKSIGRSIKSFFASNWIFMAFTAAFEVAAYYIGKGADNAADLESKMNGIESSAAATASKGKNLVDVLSATDKDNSDKSLEGKIKRMYEYLETATANSKAFIEENKGIGKLTERYDDLKNKVNEVAGALANANRFSEGVGNALQVLNGNSLTKSSTDLRTAQGAIKYEEYRQILSRLGIKTIKGKKLEEITDKQVLGDNLMYQLRKKGYFIRAAEKAEDSKKLESLRVYSDVLDFSTARIDPANEIAKELASFIGEEGSKAYETAFASLAKALDAEYKYQADRIITVETTMNDVAKELEKKFGESWATDDPADAGVITQMLLDNAGGNAEYKKRIVEGINKKYGTSFRWVPKKEKATDPEGTGDDDGKGSEDIQLKAWRREFELIKEVNSEYEKYLRYMSEEDAKAKVMSNPLYQGLGITDPSNLQGNMSNLINKISATTEQRKDFLQQVKKAESGYATDTELKGEDNKITKMKTELDLLKAQYGVYRSIYKITHNDKEARGVSGVKTTETSFTSYIENRIKGKTNTPISELLQMGSEDLKKYNAEVRTLVEQLKNANETELKQSVEEYKEFLEATKSAKDQIAEINDWAERMRKLTQDPDKQAEIEKKRQEKIAKINLDEFKKDSNWVKVFDSLDRASTTAINKLLTDISQQNFAGASVTDRKELVEAIRKLKDELEKRNPFGTLASSFSRISVLRNAYNNSKIRGSYTVSTETEGILGVKAGTELSRDQLESMLQDSTTSFKNSLSQVGESFKALESVLNPVVDLFGALGMDTSGIKSAFGIGNNALSAASGTAGAFTTLSKTFGESTGLGELFGAAGPYAAAISGAMTITTAIIGMHDEALNREIEASKQRQKEMEVLSNRIKTILQDTLGGIYTFIATGSQLSKLTESMGSHTSASTRSQVSKATASRSYYDTALASLMEQRDEVQKQLDSERAKKKSDASAISDYSNSLEDLNYQIQNFAKEMAKTLYGIDFGSWANELASALTKAWQDGTDAAIAYRDTVTSILRSVTQSALQKSIIETALSGIETRLTQQLQNDNGYLTDASWEILGELFNTAGDVSDKYLSAMEAVREKYLAWGVDIKSDSNASGLTGSVTSITESQAELLGAYMNSMRSDLYEHRLTLEQIARNQLPEMNNTMALQLASLKEIEVNTRANAASTKEIQNALNAVINGTKQIHIQ